MHTTDVAIIGAGPIGLELAACLQCAGIDYLHFDAKQIGNTISWWPRNTNFFSTSERLAIAGIPIQNPHQQRITGEEYLAYLRSVVEQRDLQVNTYEPALNIDRQHEGFLVTTQPLHGEKQQYLCQRVVVATGDMAQPNLLNIPGEDLPHVTHYFTDPHRYFRKRLLIVGGKNSAVEAALRCWRAGAYVTISYRRPAFDDHTVKWWLLPDLTSKIKRQHIGWLPETVPVEITPGHVALAPVRDGKAVEGERIRNDTDFVLLCTGFVGETTLLEQAGVTLIGEERAPQHNPDTMETDVPGFYVAGTIAAGSQRRYRLFIENCHVHAGKITAALTGNWPQQLGTIPDRKYDLPLADIRSN